MDELLHNTLDDRALVSQLVVNAQGGDRSAFDELIRRYERHVYAVALRRLSDHDEALELCQEVFVQVFLKLGQLRAPDAFGGWLRAITNRMAINRLTRRARMVSLEPEALDGELVETQTPIENVIEAEDCGHVRKGLSRLRDLDRRTLIAFYVEGRSLLEMSNEFEAPLGTIKRRLHVARKRLAREVEELVAV